MLEVAIERESDVGKMAAAASQLDKLATRAKEKAVGTSVDLRATVDKDRHAGNTETHAKCAPCHWSSAMENEHWFKPLQSPDTAPTGWDHVIGPWGLRGGELSEDVLEAAAWAWASHPYPHGWASDGNERVLDFLEWCLERCLHRNMVLRILSRASDTPESYKHDKATYENHAVFDRLRPFCAKLALTLAPALGAYYRTHDLKNVLHPINVPMSTAFEARRPGMLTQEAFLAFAHPDVSLKLREIWHELTKDEMWGSSKGLPFQWGMLVLLILLATALEEVYEAQCAGLATNEDRSRRVPIKTYERMQAKALGDHRGFDGFPGALNLDMLRKGLASPDAADQLATWDRVRKRFNVLRVKNLFDDDDNVGGAQLRFILVNVELIGPSFAEICAPGVLERALEKARVANRSIGAGGGGLPGGNMSACVINSLRRLLEEMPAIGSTPVRIAVELQLHLDEYLKARRKTHLWYKVERADSMHFLVKDCGNYFHAE